MTTHDFPDGVKVQRFSLTLMGEARLWYASLEPIAMTWPELQSQFRQQYSKVGNMREQLKYAAILWNRTLVLLEDKLSSTTVDFIRSEGKLKT